AITSVEKKKWEKAIDNELQSLVKNDVFEIVNLPEGRKTIGSVWVLRVKFNVAGNIDKYKARLCALGNTQVEGIDFEKTYSPVCRIQSIRILMAIAVEFNMKIHQMDVDTAYLNSKIDKEIYMRFPEGFKMEHGGGKVWKLKKALYGLKQAGRQWNLHIDQDLRKAGFNKCKADWCIYFKKENKRIVIVALYVDDIIIMSEEDELLQQTKDMLNHCYSMKDMGN
ncbi:Reverse transcriptase, RNA-dependent DNA polymerase domain-containing protein, partial [Rozella allomycis CSF55]